MREESAAKEAELAELLHADPIELESLRIAARVRLFAEHAPDYLKSGTYPMSFSVISEDGESGWQDLDTPVQSLLHASLFALATEPASSTNVLSRSLLDWNSAADLLRGDDQTIPEPPFTPDDFAILQDGIIWSVSPWRPDS